VDHLHGPAAQDIGGPHHQGIADALGDFQGLHQAGGHARFGLGDAQLAHHVRKRSRSSARSMTSGLVPMICTPAAASSVGDVQGGLAAELDDDPFGLLLVVDAQNVFDGEGLEVELVRGVIVRGHGFGIAVDHDGLEALVPQGEGAYARSSSRTQCPGRCGWGRRPGP
jgi:hypothetical protein